ncbi:hypothetical protein DAPPUDRAFT_105963 [Daphnia pulex]|uniref:Uncharacterized protein n=1 Tax=Daphnia pulex TaxID=6669 RepID=E9GSC7_DAPPU|nr:hypothetical protein DAPPUDRAFT_105963 [Daphnia pulex]|eukprot:EFX77688.1 hypothetical protein DAPPUDRAFT_105963 [Daphnia pulex]
MASCCCCVLYLMAGSTTGVPMSSWYGGYQTATPTPYIPKATYATTSYYTEVFKYYTTKAPGFYTTTYAAPSHYTDALKYNSAPSYYTTKATNCYTEAPADVSTKTVEYYTEAAKYYSAPIYTTTTEAAKPQVLHRRSRLLHNNVCCLVTTPSLPSTTSLKAPEFYTSMYAAPAYYTEALHYYNTEALMYYTTTCDSPSYYTDVPKYCFNYGVVLLLGVVSLMGGSTAGAGMSPCCYTEAPADYSTKTVEYYTEAVKYFSALIYTTTTEAAKNDAVPTCYTEAALSCYVELKYYTDAVAYFTTTHATPSYNTAAPKYYTEEAAFYTTTAISYGMDENDNTKFLKSGTQMEQLSYNSTATSGLHCNRMLHTMVQSAFVTPFTIWLQQDERQRTSSETHEARHFGNVQALPKSELNDLANWFLRAKSPVNFHINILHSIAIGN